VIAIICSGFKSTSFPMCCFKLINMIPFSR
jgi:hypothetical protein